MNQNLTFLVWRIANEELKKGNFSATVKYGGDSVMVWGCNSLAGVGKLIFIDRIMGKNVYFKIKSQTK